MEDKRDVPFRWNPAQKPVPCVRLRVWLNPSSVMSTGRWNARGTLTFMGTLLKTLLGYGSTGLCSGFEVQGYELKPKTSQRFPLQLSQGVLVFCLVESVGITPKPSQ